MGIGFAAALVALTAARYGLPYEAELWTGTILWSGVLAGGLSLATAGFRSVTATPAASPVAAVADERTIETYSAG